jgi:hypothetical protein
VDVLHYEEIKERMFGQWSMALIRLPVDSPRVHQQQPAFDPYATSGPEVMQQLLEWVASGQPIEMTTP